jgi:hypothetical protein
MKVRLKTVMAGPAGTFKPGQVVEDETGDLVNGGYAEPIEIPEPKPLIETAEIQSPEMAVTRKGRR